MSELGPPDPEGAAARVLAQTAGEKLDSPPLRPRGRPPGKSTAKQRAKWREQKRRQAEEEETSYEPDAAGIAACALLSQTLWRLGGPFLHLRPLTDEEAAQLGAAVDPVLKKYLPALEEWQAEVNLGVVLLGLIQATRIENKPAPEPAIEGSG